MGMRFKQWLQEVEIATKPPLQTKATQDFKSRLKARLQGVATQGKGGKPTEDPGDIVNQVATQTMQKPETGVGDAAEIAGAMQKAKDTVNPSMNKRAQ